MNDISLETANIIATAAIEKGEELGLNPLGVVILDSGGQLIVYQRQDGASSGRLQIATGKAAGALFLGVSSRKIAEVAAERPTFVASLFPLAPNGMVPAPGGVIIAGHEGHPIGAVGVSGDTSDNDETCAIAGIEAAGLTGKS
jgi:uncharacterized protein GlcG (DUF336 family)